MTLTAGPPQNRPGGVGAAHAGEDRAVRLCPRAADAAHRNGLRAARLAASFADGELRHVGRTTVQARMRSQSPAYPQAPREDAVK